MSRKKPIEGTDKRLPAVLERLKQGATTLRAESRKLGYSHNGPLRAALRELIGRDAYDKLMEGKSAADKQAAKKRNAASAQEAQA